VKSQTLCNTAACPPHQHVQPAYFCHFIAFLCPSWDMGTFIRTFGSAPGFLALLLYCHRTLGCFLGRHWKKLLDFQPGLLAGGGFPLPASYYHTPPLTPPPLPLLPCLPTAVPLSHYRLHFTATCHRCGACYTHAHTAALYPRLTTAALPLPA